jgi:phage terminase large subunit-like protein
MARKRTPRVASKWIRTPNDEKAVAAGHYFDERAAERVAQFSRDFCRHYQGRWAGQPFILEPWEYEDIIAPTYGWKRPDGTRRHRRAGEWIPKKNGKSLLESMKSLYHLVGDGELGAVVGNVAVDRE